VCSADTVQRVRYMTMETRPRLLTGSHDVLVGMDLAVFNAEPANGTYKKPVADIAKELQCAAKPSASQEPELVVPRSTGLTVVCSNIGDSCHPLPWQSLTYGEVQGLGRPRSSGTKLSCASRTEGR
jgi:hypothetical protein